jgi:hypothetical protein
MDIPAITQIKGNAGRWYRGIEIGPGRRRKYSTKARNTKKRNHFL